MNKKNKILKTPEEEVSEEETSTIQELKERLEELEIPFKKKMLFCELVDILKANRIQISVADRKKAYQEIIDLYKVQNPAKYASKEKELQTKLNAIK